MKYLKSYESLNYDKDKKDLLNKLNDQYRNKIEHCLVHLSDNYNLKFYAITNLQFEYNVVIDDISDCDEKDLIENLENSIYRLNNELNAECYIEMCLNHDYKSVVDVELEKNMTIKDLVYSIYYSYNDYLNNKNYRTSNKKEIQLIVNLNIV